MNIYTERVDPQKCRHVIDAEIQKHSQEYRVLATLRYIYQGKYSGLELKEAPDLQDSETRLGIEVTNAVDVKEMRLSREFSKYRNSTGSYASKALSIIKEQGGDVIETPIGPILDYPMFSDDNEESFFKRAIIHKYEKLSKYRQKCVRVGLAVIMDLPSQNAERNIINWIKQCHDETGGDIFDFYYVISERFLLFFDTFEDIHKNVKISHDENCRLKIIGGMTAEGKIKLSDYEWDE